MTSPDWLVELSSCDSTNSWALAQAGSLPHGTCIFTRNQTAGRGQPGRIWHAPPGVLTASFLLVLGNVSPSQCALAAGLAVAHACEDLAPALRIQIKWPNDCLIAGRKLAGILCERPAGDQGRMVVGIGLNLDPRWDLRPESLPLVADARYAPVSLAEAGCWPLPDPLDLLAGLRRYLLEAAGLIAAGGWSHLRDGISARDYLAGKLLRLETAQGILVGRGAGIDETGRLLIHTAEGLVPIASARFLNSAEV